ncbi:Serine/threonine-protein kinase B [Achromobacter xylosoxidans]|uniref:pentapeptide repeat-containing protein n=1 Tax=Alcaligenes xylosoxydans xylosoxydans TaxID=85698 RepID=UPI0006C1655C|nr:pentapeptide repeat-containing protein [Achromobacter xylosoxidans]CUK21984.1 Serine/threonine-protein kinase B [Achromobacter xylosoxidans]
MHFEIKNRWTGAVLFTADVPEGTESGLIARVALEQAVEASAYLGDANLRGADLRGANLGDANLRGADLRGANLGGANLRGADLRGANLRGANLGGADLRDANLGGANLGELRGIWGASGNLREIKAIQCDTWPVTYTATHMQIGCQFHELERWWSFTDEQIARMDSSALEWWQKWKPVLHTIITMSPAVPGGEKPAEDSHTD